LHLVSIFYCFSLLFLSHLSSLSAISGHQLLEHDDDDKELVLEHDELQLDLAIPAPTVPSPAQISPAQDGWVITHRRKRQRKRKEERDIEAGGLQTYSYSGVGGFPFRWR
jgi:hypothetical protein